MKLWLESVCLTTLTTILLVTVAIQPSVFAQRIISSQTDIDLARVVEKASNSEIAVANLARKVEQGEKDIADARLELAALNGRMQGFGAAVVGLQLLHLGLLFFGWKKRDAQ
jgi:hypothetical protein